MKHSFFLILWLVFTQISLGQIQFTEQAEALGCGDISFGNGDAGGGISFYDFDNDGWDDITVARHQGEGIVFLKHEGGSYVEIDLGINNTGNGKTVQWVDFDNDGDNDFFATSDNSSVRLYQNDGSMSFIDITEAAGLLDEELKSWGSSWGDYDKDGYLDVFINTRDILPGATGNQLYKNNGDGTFINTTTEAGISPDNYLSLCASFFDYNNDGELDIYVSNDKPYKLNLLYQNQGDGTFLEVAELAGVDLAFDAMSTAIGDYNGDGYFDIYVTNTPDGNAFLKNNGDGTFTDIAASNGTLMETVAWGAVFIDPDNNKKLDLYVSSSSATGFFQGSAFYENMGDGNYEIPQGIGFDDDVYISFSNAMGDLNNDGFPEIIVSNMLPDDMKLWVNDSPQSNNWLKVKLQGSESNLQGIGSVIEISSNGEKQYNYTLLGEGFLGQNSSYEFFGIGEDTSIDYIKVTWPSGIIDFIVNPEINNSLTLVEGENILSSENFAASNIVLYPNPASERLFIKGLVGDEQLLLYDLEGRLVLETNTNSTEKTIEISQFSTGVYFLEILGYQQLITKKLVIR